MTDQEIQDIIRKYKSGQSMANIALEHYLSGPTVRNILVRNNVAIRARPPRRTPGQWQMIINDYNAGKDLESMARVYGYKSVASLEAAISIKRQEGHDIKRRGRKRKKETLL